MREDGPYGECQEQELKQPRTEEEPMLSILRAISRRVAAIIAECNYVQRRLAALRASPDRYMIQPDVSPDTYQEFLFRTSGHLAHEPSAAKRTVGHAVR
jgi:hypothetical protein